MQISRYAANHGVAFPDLLNTEADEGCVATDGPPKIGPPGPYAAKYVAVDGPPDHVWLP